MKEREDWIDYLRGVAILLVVLGHAIRPSMQHDYVALNILFWTIYSIHMPLFFMISGYLLSKSINSVKAFGEFFLKKCKVYLIPFLSYSMIIYLMIKVFCFYFSSDLLNDENIRNIEYYHIFLIGVLKGENPFATHLWFLPALFLMVIFSAAVYWVIGKNYANACLGISIILWCLVALLNFKTIHVLKMVMWDYVYFSIGLIFKMLYDKLTQYKKELFLFLTAFFVTYIVIYTYLTKYLELVQIYIYILQIVRFFAISVICMSSAVLSRCIYKGKMLKWIGKNSMEIYLFHQPFCCAFFGTLLYEKVGVSFFLVIIIEMGLSVIGVLSIMAFMTKNNIAKSTFHKVFAITYKELT